MNILFLPQYANRSYSTGKWTLLKDGHVGMIKNQMKALAQDKECKVILAVPPLEDIEDINSYNELVMNYLTFKLSKNVAYNRFHFDMNQFLLYKEVLLSLDLIITDVPELTRNLRMFFTLQKKDVKIISNVHYLDIYPENQISDESNYFWSQLNGLLCSDSATFLTKKYFKDFCDYARELITFKVLNPLRAKSMVLDYMAFSEDSLNLFKKEKSDEKIIFFISRCSDEKRTKWREFIESVKLLRESRQDFSVFIANPTHIKADVLIEEIGDASDYISFPTEEFTKRDYIEKLWESHCVPLLYDIENNLAVGFYEAIYCDNIPVQFRKEFSDMRTLDLALSNALDKNVEDCLDRKEEFVRNHSSEYNTDRFNSFIEEVMRK